MVADDAGVVVVVERGYDFVDVADNVAVEVVVVDDDVVAVAIVAADILGVDVAVGDSGEVVAVDDARR